MDKRYSVENYVIGPVLAGEPFRLDWERDETVAACPHVVWECCIQRGPSGFVQQVVRCQECQAPRCGHSTAEDPCILVRHHRGLHLYLSNKTAPVAWADGDQAKVHNLARWLGIEGDLHRTDTEGGDQTVTDTSGSESP